MVPLPNKPCWTGECPGAGCAGCRVWGGPGLLGQSRRHIPEFGDCALTPSGWTTEDPTETLNTIPKAVGGPHMVHLAPDYDLFLAMAVRPSQCWWILFGTWHHCGAGGPAVPGLALGRVWIRKVAINLTTHTHQCTLRAFYLKSGKLWPGPSFWGQRPEKACWESTFPAWSWPSLTTQKNMPITHKIHLWVSTVSPEFARLSLFFPVSVAYLHLPCLGLIFTCTPPLVLHPLTFLLRSSFLDLFPYHDFNSFPLPYFWD